RQQRRALCVLGPARDPRHNNARSLVKHPNTRGAFSNAGGDGSGGYSSSSHSRPDRLSEPAPDAHPGRCVSGTCIVRVSQAHAVGLACIARPNRRSLGRAH
ncbi:MAG: hypothetical protein L3K06_06230, partial [Thermoplasmata archaeon]|nr:hypothetical protein [Thermoplasmata archaeon]